MIAAAGKNAADSPLNPPSPSAVGQTFAVE
jgi:hypothetical protein